MGGGDVTSLRRLRPGPGPVIPPQGHLLCVLLVACDLAARTARVRSIAAGAGHRLTVADGIRINLLADAAATVTPMRLGGEPARMAAIRWCGLPGIAIALTVSCEMMTGWTMLVMLALPFFGLLAPEWLAEVGPGLVANLAGNVGIVAAVAAAMLLMLAAAKMLPRRLKAPVRGVVDGWQRMPRRILLISLLCSAVNIVARTSLLPAIILTMPDPPAAAALWLGSFILIYGQLVIPTPAGLGAVELGFLGGLAGEAGGAATLVAWRWWSSGVTVLLGMLAVACWRRRRLTVP